MKKKSPNISAAAKAERDSRGGYPYFCQVAVTDASALGGIALRVIMSDIPKQKSMRGRAPRSVEEKTSGEE